MSSMNMTTVTDVRQHILDVARPLMLAKGFTAVGLSEVLATAGVPKGSFYHYFGSKEAFGEALLDAYFADYLAHLDALLARPGTAAEQLMGYWRHWLATQSGEAPEACCLVVKLGAEVCDLSERMRAALERGTEAIVARLAARIEAGGADGSLPAGLDARGTAATLYQAWLGASLLAKITHSREPLETAMATTCRLLGVASRGAA